MAVAVATTSRVRRLTTSASRPRTPSRILAAAVGLELVVKGLEADAEHVGGPRLVVAVGGQSLEDQRLLGVLEARAHPEGDRVGPFPGLDQTQRGHGGNVLGQDGV